MLFQERSVAALNIKRDQSVLLKSHLFTLLCTLSIPKKRSHSTMTLLVPLANRRDVDKSSKSGRIHINGTVYDNRCWLTVRPLKPVTTTHCLTFSWVLVMRSSCMLKVEQTTFFALLRKSHPACLLQRRLVITTFSKHCDVNNRVNAIRGGDKAWHLPSKWAVPSLRNHWNSLVSRT